MVLFGSLKQKLGGIIGWFWHLSLVKKVGIIIVIVLIGWFGLPKILGQKSNQPQYQTAQAQRGTLIQSVSASGNVTSGGNVTITTNATGIIQTISVKKGDSVTQGQQIGTIALDQNSQQQQAAAYASYLSAQNNLNSAKSNMNQLQAALFQANQAFVNDTGIANPTAQDMQNPKYIEENATWLQAEANYNNQQGVINQAQAGVTSAWLSYQQSSSVITAPSAGIISNLIISPGYQIVANTSSSNSSSNPTTLGTIALRGGQLQATVNLSEVDVTRVKVGQKATLTLDAFADKTFTGKVTAIDTTGAVASGVTTYPATITFDSSDPAIYPNMGVSAKIITDVKDNVMLVPSGAVQTQNGETTVRVLRNGQVQTVPVTVGESSDTDTEITSGLSEGDMVVTSIALPAATTGAGRAATSPFSALGGGNAVFRTGGGGFGGGARAGGTGR